MVHIILVFEVWTIHFRKQRQCIACVRQEVIRTFKTVQCFNDYLNTCHCCNIGNPGKIFTNLVKLLLTASHWDATSFRRKEMFTSNRNILRSHFPQSTIAYAFGSLLVLKRNINCSSTRRAASTSSTVTDSAGLWLIPPRQRTKSMAILVSSESVTAS